MIRSFDEIGLMQKKLHDIKWIFEQWKLYEKIKKKILNSIIKYGVFIHFKYDNIIWWFANEF